MTAGTKHRRTIRPDTGGICDRYSGLKLRHKAQFQRIAEGSQLWRGQVYCWGEKETGCDLWLPGNSTASVATRGADFGYLRGLGRRARATPSKPKLSSCTVPLAHAGSLCCPFNKYVHPLQPVLCKWTELKRSNLYTTNLVAYIQRSVKQLMTHVPFKLRCCGRVDLSGHIVSFSRAHLRRRPLRVQRSTCSVS
ncbi:hypothetical protein SISSUDRAFT_432611 [Sistotremastrum suecicum HHB10207 ss-3]|uniref:Uncharacterized protein n=1 Tax=Sistotremastrum suecicum HHB10207 ss-3 TaxID=1314776 RepID=A0A165YGN3_9AGAM|nr:hypothetical protein SISSUDRAFT_432611 [Sistotremastrum suecicum HHB10207 ss-3]